MKGKKFTKQISGVDTDPTVQPYPQPESGPGAEMDEGSPFAQDVSDTSHGGYTRPSGDSVHMFPFENTEPFDKKGKKGPPGDYNKPGKVSIAGRQLPAAGKKKPANVPMNKGKIGKPTQTRGKK